MSLSVSRSRLWLLGSVGALACCVTLSGATVVVRHPEGIVHGFLALSTLDGKTGVSLAPVAAWFRRRARLLRNALRRNRGGSAPRRDRARVPGAQHVGWNDDC